VRGFKTGMLMLATLAATSGIGCDRGDSPTSIGHPAPGFVISDGASTVDLNQLHGKVVVLNLWASYCAPCVEELPSLLALHEKMPQIAIVAVSTDQDNDVYRKFLDRHHVTLTTVRDEQGRVNQLYGTQLIPETYIIDRNGVIRRKFISAQDWTSPDITEYLKRL
jgi:cytochrome c biogenesis protein CcmG, thiol:disulfide interchange protein DsbE